MTEQLTETTMLVWYCQRCRKSYKAQPAIDGPTCQCKTPVPSLHPTEVTVVEAPKRRPMHALTDEEGRLRALARKGTKVRVTVTYEGEITDAWQWTSVDGARNVEFVVDTPDGKRHAVDPQRAGVRIEAANSAADE